MVLVTPPAAASTVRPARPLAPGRTVPSRRQRRISGPARPARPERANDRTAGQTAQRAAARRRAGLVPWLLGALEALSSHRLLDRLIRGRLWIGIIAFALLGIVTLQLGLLKLNSGIGRSLERSSSLQRDNAALAIENSELTSGERVESQATGKLGMGLGSITGLHALSSHPSSDVGQAAAALQSHAQGSSTASATGEAPTEAAAKAAPSATGGETANTGEAHTASGEASASAGGGTQSTSEAHAASETAESHATSEAGGTSEANSSHPESGGEAPTAAAAPASSGETGGGTAGPGG